MLHAARGGRLLAFVRDSPPTPSRRGPKAPGGGVQVGQVGVEGGVGTRPWWLAPGGGGGTGSAYLPLPSL